MKNFKIMLRVLFVGIDFIVFFPLRVIMLIWCVCMCIHGKIKYDLGLVEMAKVCIDGAAKQSIKNKRYIYTGKYD